MTTNNKKTSIFIRKPTNTKQINNENILLFLFGSNKAWPWSYVSLYMIENQGTRSSILRILFGDIWYFNFMNILHFFIIFLFWKPMFFLLFLYLFLKKLFYIFNFQNCFCLYCFKKNKNNFYYYRTTLCFFFLYLKLFFVLFYF